MSSRTNILILSCFLFLITGFQNCHSNGFEKPAGLNADSDSGTPYEGKIFVQLGEACADKTEFQSRIVVLSPTQAELNRENCQDISPVALSSTDFQLSADSRLVVYRNQNYSFLGSNSAGITQLSISNDSQNFYYSYAYEGHPSWLQIYLDTDQNPATGYSHNGIGADYLIENDNVWIYSAEPGAPRSTWAWKSLASAHKINIESTIRWSFPKIAIGSPSQIQLIAQTSLGARTGIIIQVVK